VCHWGRWRALPQVTLRNLDKPVKKIPSGGGRELSDWEIGGFSKEKLGLKYKNRDLPRLDEREQNRLPSRSNWVD